MSLRNSLEEMQKKEVFHVKEEVSPRFEASSIVKAFDGGPVLFFGRVKNYETKIAEIIEGMRETLKKRLHRVKASDG